MSSQEGEPTTLPSLKREDQVLCPLRSTDTQLPVFDWALSILMVRLALWPCQCHLASSLWLGLCGLGLTRPLLGSVLGVFVGSASVGLGLWLARPLLGSALCPVHAARPWLARPLLPCCWLLSAGCSAVVSSADWALWPLDWALWLLDVRAAVRWVLDVALLALISGSPCLCSTELGSSVGLNSTALGFAGLYWAVSLSLRTGLSAMIPPVHRAGCTGIQFDPHNKI